MGIFFPYLCQISDGLFYYPIIFLNMLIKRYIGGFIGGLISSAKKIKFSMIKKSLLCIKWDFLPCMKMC